MPTFEDEMRARWRALSTPAPAALDVERLAQAMESVWPGWLDEAPGTDEARAEMREHAAAIAAEYARLALDRAVTERDALDLEMPTITEAWALVESVMPEGYFISALRTRGKKARWSASVTLDLDPSGANYSGFGPTPVDALLDLRGKLADRLAEALS